MKKNFYFVLGILFVTLIVQLISGCGKDKPAPTDPCAGKAITITATLTPVSPGQTANGAIAATASGSSNFSFSINSGAYQSSGTFAGLAAGNYTIYAKDGEGCVKSQSFSITTTPCPTISVTATVVNASSSTATNGSITASASGSSGYTYSINNGAFQAAGLFSNLATGNYTVTAKDANGCTGSATFTVAAAQCPAIAISATTTQASGPTATNGSITATASGGTGPYTYSKDGNNFQASGTFSNLSAGNYTIVAKDANGCTGTSAAIAVTSAPCPSISITSTNTASDKCLNNNGTITVTASGSTAFTYRLNNGAFQASNIFTALANGNYTIEVKDANGCTATNTAFVPISPAGTKFTAVKSLMATYCGGCHGSSSPQGGVNLTDDCTIAAKAARIKARAVDATPTQMPPLPNPALSATDKQKITDWINAGGRYSD